MGQVRWAGWTVAIAALVFSSGPRARADIASDKPAAIVVYPYVKVNTQAQPGFGPTDTIIRLTNTNANTPILAHCFYLDANAHCVGGTNSGAVCNLGNPAPICGAGVCQAGWLETDFYVRLTAGQPIEWTASHGIAGVRTCDGGTNANLPCRIDADCPGSTCDQGGRGLPLASGFCIRNPFRTCGSDADCNPFPGGACTQSNVGSNVPPVPEDPFQGELKCIVIDENGIPDPRNDLKGEAILTTVLGGPPDVASYNAIGIQATGASVGAANELNLGGPDPEYNGCPNYLILNHFFYGVNNPAPGSPVQINTNLVLVPCSQDLLRQIGGVAVIQYLVFNEFEQRFSTSRKVDCFQDIPICNLDTPSCTRSIFHVGVAGTVTGQTRMQAIGISPLPSSVLGIGLETHVAGSTVLGSAAFNLHMQGLRSEADVITLP